jgi:integrase
MQTRPYSNKDGLKIWLNQQEQQQLLEATDDRDGRPRPERALALNLGLHGFRTDEIVPTDNGPGVIEAGVRKLGGGEGYVIEIQDGKTATSIREVPLDPDVARDIFALKRGASKRKDDPLLDVNPRTVRTWVYDAREVLDEPAASELGMHDLRRTWATSTYYALAVHGVPIAEELTMSWGGWAHTSTGRETFRNNYLGPVPDRIVAECLGALPMTEETQNAQTVR